MISQMISWSMLSQALTFTLQDPIAVHFQGRIHFYVRFAEKPQSENVAAAAAAAF